MIPWPSYRIAAIAAVVACVAGCRPDTGRTVKQANVPLRIVSMLPNATEILFDLGLGDRVVGVTRYCDRPPAAAGKPKVGGILDVSTEAVLALKPDLVIGSRSVLRGRLADLLELSGASVLPLSFETMASVPAGIEAIGEATGRTDRARRLVERYEASVGDLRGRASREPPVKVLFIAGVNPLVVAGGDSFIGGLLSLSGLENVADSGGIAYPTWSIEQVIRAAPDVVVDGTMGRSDVRAVVLGAGLTGCRVVVPGDEALLRPGPSSVRAAIRLVDEVVRALGNDRGAGV